MKEKNRSEMTKRSGAEEGKERKRSGWWGVEVVM